MTLLQLLCFQKITRTYSFLRHVCKNSFKKFLYVILLCDNWLKHVQENSYLLSTRMLSNGNRVVLYWLAHDNDIIMWLALMLTIISTDSFLAGCRAKADIAFIVDTSRYMTRLNLRRVKKYLRGVLRRLSFSARNFRVGVVGFGSSPRVTVNFANGMTKRAAYTGISLLRYFAKLNFCPSPWL